MNTMRNFILLIFLIMSYTCNVYAAEKKVIKIGVEGLIGGNYKIGLKLCNYISESNDGIKCEIVPTNGSINSISLLQQGKVDFSLVLSNFALDAYNGTGSFAKAKPFKDMYQVLRLYDEIFLSIVKDDNKTLVFADLNDKKLSNGPPDSDSSFIYKKLESYYNFNKLPIDIELSPANYANALCNDKIDAIILMAEHSSELMNLISNSCDINFTTINPEQVELLVQNNPGFNKVIIGEDKYSYVIGEHETVSVPVIFVASSSVNKQIVENFISYFKTKISRFTAADPILSDIENDHFMSSFVLPDLNDSIKK